MYAVFSAKGKPKVGGKPSAKDKSRPIDEPVTLPKRAEAAPSPPDRADAKKTAAKLTFSIVTVGKSTRAEVSAFWGDDLLDHAQFAVPKTPQREKYIANLQKKCPEIDAATADRMLVERAAAIAVQLGKAEQIPVGDFSLFASGEHIRTRSASPIAMKLFR